MVDKKSGPMIGSFLSERFLLLQKEVFREKIFELFFDHTLCSPNTSARANGRKHV